MRNGWEISIWKLTFSKTKTKCRALHTKIVSALIRKKGEKLFWNLTCQNRSHFVRGWFWNVWIDLGPKRRIPVNIFYMTAAGENLLKVQKIRFSYKSRCRSRWGTVHSTEASKASSKANKIFRWIISKNLLSDIYLQIWF